MTQQTQSGEERAMGENQLHVVFGTGQVGNALAAHLARVPARLFSLLRGPFA